MKDLYKLLGINENASLTEVKKAYRASALENHPDKGGDAERMKLLNEAYNVLSDPDKRRDFNARWSAFQESSFDEEESITIDSYLQSNALPFSMSFRNDYAAGVEKFEQEPLSQEQAINHLLNFESNLYSYKNSADESTKHFHDIFSYINYQTAHASRNTALTSSLKQELSLSVALDIFTKFLHGAYVGSDLRELKKYFSAQLDKVRAVSLRTPYLLLYEAIFEIILLTENHQTQYTLLHSIKKITEFAKMLSDGDLPLFFSLLYSKVFRNLYAYSLHLYWRTSEVHFNAENLAQFDGQNETKKLLEVLRDQLTHSESSNELRHLIRYIKLLYLFEKDKNIQNHSSPTGSYYREKAFTLLDWIPALALNASAKITANVFLQIGLYFQRASRLEECPAIKMADEMLALKIYLTCVSIGIHATPDVEMYISTHALKYISHFCYKHTQLSEIIPALQKRVLIITDIFPFYEGQQANIALLKQADKPILLMRRLLNVMAECIEYNKTHSISMPIDHSAASVLYQMYEACLKNWYQEKHDSIVEKKLRLELIEELLFEEGWTFLDVDQNVDSLSIMVDRDEQGWMKPSRVLPYPNDKNLELYRGINGAEINYRTGEVTLFFDPWKQTQPPYQKLFTLLDVKEIVEKNLTSAIFSLDPVDPNRFYHPFNQMNFAPAQLCETELFNTMLLTDYILKFLTTNQEVQGRYPYEQRPIDHLIQHLPNHLKRIIEDYQREKHAGALHRFWIEAEEIDIAVAEPEITRSDVARISLGNLRMVVKKHKMERDLHGELKDVGNEDEGWPIYVLTPEQMQELTGKRRSVSDRAMILLSTEVRIIFWENNRIIKELVPEKLNETIVFLNKQPRNTEEKIIQNAKNISLLYQATVAIAAQAGLPHQYSSEFIFAYQLTKHYNELAQYFPEFGRLKELSKVATAVRFLSGIREPNREDIQAIDALISRSPMPDTDAAKRYSQKYLDRTEEIKLYFRQLDAHFSEDALSQKWTARLKKIQADVRSLSFYDYLEKALPACKKWHNDMINAEYWDSPERIWNKANSIWWQIFKWSISLPEEIYEQLIYEILNPLLLFHYNDTTSAIKKLIAGNSDAVDCLAEGLTETEMKWVSEDAEKKFQHSSARNIQDALQGSEGAIIGVVNNEFIHEMNQVKRSKQILESGFARLGLAKDKTPADTAGRCFWVPASIRHEVHETNLTRFSIFVYGGVRIQPNINVVRGGGGGPLGGNPVGGKRFDTARITEGFQNHHIIAKGHPITKNHELLRLAGMDVDKPPNRIFLPKEAGRHGTRSIHDGGHTNDAMKKVRDKMDTIVAQGKSENWSQSQYREATRQMLAQFRQDLKKGDVALNVKHRSWANK